MKTTLREVIYDDLAHIFEIEKDPDAIQMAAFIFRDPNNWQEFIKHWNKILIDPENYNRTIMYDNKVVGNILSFIMQEQREVGYWIDKNYWGKGIATEALKLFLDEIKERPLYAHVAYDNIGSMKVLQKCGFIKIGDGKYFAKARNMEIDEIIFKVE